MSLSRWHISAMVWILAHLLRSCSPSSHGAGNQIQRRTSQWVSLRTHWFVSLRIGAMLTQGWLWDVTHSYHSCFLVRDRPQWRLLVHELLCAFQTVIGGLILRYNMCQVIVLIKWLILFLLWIHWIANFLKTNRISFVLCHFLLLLWHTHCPLRILYGHARVEIPGISIIALGFRIDDVSICFTCYLCRIH